AASQCILANPSFEIDGSGGPVFGGWQQFGQFGSVAIAIHGSQAARVSGPGGDWSVSGYWQRLDSEPGEQWEATGHVQHPSGAPLTGSSVALVNIEWRDGNGDLIDYDSFVVADPSTPRDAYVEFALLSDPAPAGTAAIHFLLGVLQGAGEPPPDVYFDQVTIFSTSPPTMDEMQWSDFPGGRAVDFAGRSWRVKGPGFYGPGPNVFCDDPDCVWVDGEGRLHLTLSDQGSHWAATEVALEEALGYGDYIVTTVGRLDLLAIQAVLGIFLWQYGPCWDEAYLWWNPYNEIDIEYSRWGYPSNEIGQFVAQPYDWPGNTERFDATFAEGEVVSHAMRWLPDRVEYRVWRGGPEAESPQTLIHEWTYTGPHIPRPEQPRMHLNLWKLEGNPAADQEVLFSGFVFVPADAPSAIDEPQVRAQAAAGGTLMLAGPNPFHAWTTIRFDLFRDATVDLGVFSLDGRRVRTLVRGILGAGLHTASWDGRDDRGRAVGSGVYLIRLTADPLLDTRRIVRIE
ncbi:MAG: hypothetical protein GF330_07230, partial [Candidatus Eisenbacteria bacterium]|nr:hypothetical protein [Candidatus Eisenbacteria bacterium]